MTSFDIIILALLAVSALLGLMRGFVQEVMGLIAWVTTILAVRFLHEPTSAYLAEPVGSQIAAGIAALVGLYLVAWLAGRWIARSLGERTRRSVVGPLDRVLGFGFGAIKGLIVASLGFLLIVMAEGYFWPNDGRPEWMTQSRTYPLLNASANALVEAVEQGRAAGGLL